MNGAAPLRPLYAFMSCKGQLYLYLLKFMYSFFVLAQSATWLLKVTSEKWGKEEKPSLSVHRVGRFMDVNTQPTNTRKWLPSEQNIAYITWYEAFLWKCKFAHGVQLLCDPQFTATHTRNSHCARAYTFSIQKHGKGVIPLLDSLLRGAETFLRS